MMREQTPCSPGRSVRLMVQLASPKRSCRDPEIGAAMNDHRLPRTAGASRWIPFGLGQVKPKHFRNMAEVVWENRDNLGYAWKVLSRGVCDGCALGVAGFHDWTIDGVHLCMTRLNLLRLNTMPAMDPERLADVSKLASLDNRALRDLGRLAHPMR